MKMMLVLIKSLPNVHVSLHNLDLTANSVIFSGKQQAGDQNSNHNDRKMM